MWNTLTSLPLTEGKHRLRWVNDIDRGVGPASGLCRRVCMWR